MVEGSGSYVVVALNLEPTVWRGLCLPCVTGRQSEVEATSCRRQSRSAGRECLEQLGCGEHWPISGGGEAKPHLSPQHRRLCIKAALNQALRTLSTLKSYASNLGY